MSLTGPQTKKLHDALLSAFDGNDLEQLVRFELDANLDAITGGGPLTQVVFDLINWAVRQGRIEELIRAAAQHRPGNPQMRAAVDELLKPAAAPASPGGGGLDGPRRARLRAVLLDQFPNRAELAILLDDTLSQPLDQVAGGSNLMETVFNLLQWMSVDPQQRLRPFLAEAAKRRPNSAELAALNRELYGA